MPDKTETFKALAAGSVMIDTIAVIADDDIERVSMKNLSASFLMMEQGRKVDAENITNHVGGGGANVSVALARQGLDVDLLGVVGRGINASRARAALESSGVGLKHLLGRRDLGTGASVLVSSHDQNAAIFTNRGANGHMAADQIDAIDFLEYDMVHIAPLSNASADQFPRLVKKARAAGCFVSANPGIRQLTSRPEPFFQTATEIDLLAVNTAEVSALVPHLAAMTDQRTAVPVITGKDLPNLLQRGLRFGGFIMGLAEVMRRLQSIGPSRILVTDGKRGAYLLSGDMLYYVGSSKVTPKGTAGAGDAFVSTLSACLARGWDADRALKAATLNSASVVMHVDTQTGLLSMEEIEAALKDCDLPAMAWDCPKLEASPSKTDSRMG